MSATGHLEVDEPKPVPDLGTVGSGVLDRAAFQGHLRGPRARRESTGFVLDHLGATFTPKSSTSGSTTSRTRDTHRNARLVTLLRSIAARGYHAHFPEDTHLSERVLWPATAE